MSERDTRITQVASSGVSVQSGIEKELIHDMEKVAFYVLTAVALLAATVAVTRRNITHAAIALGAALFAVAGIFLLLRATSPFVLQLLLVIVLAAVLMYFPDKHTEQRSSGSKSFQSSRAKLVAISIAIFLLGQVVVTAFVGSNLATRGLLLLAAASSANQTLIMSEVLRALVQNYLLPCEIVVVLVLAAGVARNAIRGKDA